MEVVMKGTFPCPICKCDRTFQVFGFANPGEAVYFRDPKVIKDATEDARWYHWCDVHRLCAVCGKHIEPGADFVCAANSGEVAIHPDYNDYFQKVRRGDMSRLLDVHKACLEAEATHFGGA